MDKNSLFLIELSKKSLLNYEIVTVPNNIDWDYLFEKSSEQNITALIADAIMGLSPNMQPENIDRWKNALIQTVCIMSKKNAGFERVVNLLSESEIIPLCLKGTVVKDIYPIPELRTMGDFDIMIESNQCGKVEDILRKNGYSIKKDTLFMEVDKNGVHGEIFYSFEDDFKNNPEYWNMQMKENTYINNNRRLLTPSYELAYSVIHAAKHFTREGCGIRNLFDVVVLLQKRENIDFNIIEKICKSQGYEKILYYMITVAENWYGVKIDSNIHRMDIDKTEKFLEYLLSGGVFGKSTEGNILITQVVKREGHDVNAFRRIFFPPRKMMWHKYQYLKKSPLLLPVAWVHRFITAVFVKKYSVVSMITGINESIDYGKDREKWLNELDIK